MIRHLRPEHLEAWHRDGFLCLPGFLSPDEAATVAEWVDEIASWADSDDAWLHHREETPGGVRLSRSENFMPFHEGMRGLLTEGRVVEAVGEAMGEPAVLYKEKINYKYPGGGGYAAHQDAPAYDFIDTHVTCLIAVDDTTPDNGCLFFTPARHREGLLALDDNGCIEPGVAESLPWKPMPLEPGDVLLFSSYAPHYSPPNLSDAPRRALYLTYNAAAEGDLHDQYYADKRQSFAAANSGSVGRISKIGHFQGTTVTA